MTKKLLQINAQISDILTKLEDFSDEISINVLNNDQKLEFLDLNNQLFDLNIQKRRELLEIDKQTINVINKAFAPKTDGEEIVYENNRFLELDNNKSISLDFVNENNNTNKSKKWPTGKKTFQSKLIDCLKENGPQTSFQLAQNLNLKISNTQRVILELKRKNLIKSINQLKTKKNGSGEMEVYDIVG